MDRRELIRRSRDAVRIALIVGVLLRLVRPEVHSFWFDEGATLLAAQAPDLLAFLRHDSHPPLAFLLVRAWSAVFGQGDFALRLLPALAACLALLLFAPLARRWLGERRAPWAVALYAVSPLLVWYAHEVRMYAFVELATLVVLHAALWLWRAPGQSRWIAVTAAVAVVTGLHYYGALAGLAVCAQAALRYAKRRLALLDVLVTAAACALGVGVWTPWLVTILPAQYANEWPRIALFGWREVAEMPVRLVAVDLIVLVEHGVPWIGWVLGALCSLGPVVWFLRTAVRFNQGALDALCVAFVPLLAALVLAWLVNGGFQPRYLTVAAPGMIACVAGGIATLPPAWLGRAAGSVLLAAALATTVLQLAGNRREDYRTACAEIVERWQSGDRLLVIACVPRPYVRATVEHYLRDRPDILGATIDAEAYLDGGDRPPSGTRLHVLWRSATICWEPFGRLRSTHVFEEESEARFRITRFLTRVP